METDFFFHPTPKKNPSDTETELTIEFLKNLSNFGMIAKLVKALVCMENLVHPMLFLVT